MQIAFNKLTALAILRTLRAQNKGKKLVGKRCDLPAPSKGERKKWTRSVCGFQELGLDFCNNKEWHLDVAIPSKEDRVRFVNSTYTIYSEGLPRNSFCEVGNGICISSPELLFVELASELDPLEHLMVGHELCGSFSRDAIEPYDGEVSFKVDPVTSVERITQFIEGSRRLWGIGKARRTLELLADNAWSPTESLIAAFMSMPIDQCGYELGPVKLNPRVSRDEGAGLAAVKASRVPDIVVAETKVGINYDGMLHLDLASIAEAAKSAAQNPDSPVEQDILDSTVANVRAKVVDDVRRNRELASAGYTIIPAVKEDLYEQGGLDRVMMLVIESIEREKQCTLERQRKALSKKALGSDRQKLIRSFLPGTRDRKLARRRFIGGFLVAEGPATVEQVVIEL